MARPNRNRIRVKHDATAAVLRRTRVDVMPSRVHGVTSRRTERRRARVALRQQLREGDGG